MIISALAFFILVILGHYFAWHLSLSACPALKIKKYWLLTIYIVVTITFLASFIYLHQFDGIIFKYIYVISAVLFGLLSQLMLLGALYYLLKCLTWFFSKFKIFYKKYNLLLARIFILLAFCLFILGTYNAFYPQVKNIDLDNWTEDSKEQSIIHLSDLHLGAIYRPTYLDRIVRQVNALDADLVIISGDLFDGSDRSLSEFIEPLSKFSAPTIFVPGNHDSYILDSEIDRVVSSADLINLSDSARVFNNIEVIGFEYYGREESAQERFIDNLDQRGNDLAKIVVNHVPVDQAEAKALGANLMLSGHAHRGQIFPFSIVTNFIYGRFAYGLEDYEGMSVYTSAGTATWGPPLRTLFPGEIIRFNLN